MRRHRGILTVLVSAALLAAAAIAAAALLYPSLPNPEHANRRELIRWLVTRDLTQVPTATRAVLALRLEEEFSGEIDWPATASELTDAQRLQLCENVPLLVGPWMQAKAGCYSTLSVAERMVYLDGLIDTLQQWRGLDEIAPASAAKGQSRPGLMAGAMEQVAVIKEHADPAERAQLSEFMLALETRWTMRELGRRLQSAADLWRSGQ
jgi:hypothetical protein